MEIIVSVSIFVVVSMAMLALFNYVLQINRRADALRQATQGMRNLTEFLVKEVRNGKVDYGVSSGKIVGAGPGTWPCPSPSGAVGGDNSNSGPNIYGRVDPSLGFDNTLAIVTTQGERECIFLAQDQNGTYDPGKLTGAALMISKGGQVESITPPNFQVRYAAFAVRPLKDPYTMVPAGSSPKVQPTVTFSVQFVAKLPTGEEVKIPYQTTVASDKYDVPTN